MNQSKLLKSLVLLCALIPSLIFAANREEVDPEVTPSSVQKVVVEEEGEQEVQLGSSGYIFDRYPNIYLPTSAHLLVGVSALGNEIELEDGSIWKISPYDSSKSLNWNSNTPLVILQNTSWFSSYGFRIVNQADRSSIAVNLFQGPFKGGEFSRYVEEIDYSRGLLRLSDATHWEIHPSDRSLLFNWMQTEPVIIGQNADYDANWNPYWEAMLINVRKTKKFIRAHQY